MTETSEHRQPGHPRARVIGLLAGPIAAAAVIASPAPDGLSQSGWWVAAVAAWMAIWWMTEALPLAVTALLPLVLFPALGIRDIDGTAPAYAHPLIFLFLGGFLLARAMHVHGLDRRVALNVLRLVGTSPRRLIGGVMVVTAFLSMWISNTATAMVMLPIGLSLVANVSREDETETGRVAPALLLGIAYAATIGGMGTIIGTPPNAIFAAFMARSYGIEISFVRWMLVGVPLMLVMLLVAWLVLTRVAFRVGDRGLHRSSAALADELAAIAPFARAEQLVTAVMLLVAACWVFRPVLDAALPWLRLSDAGIAIVGAILLFILPAERGGRRALLTWQEAAGIRWDVLILFGGGLALAAVIGETDLAGWIGDKVSGLRALPVLVLLLAVGAVIVLFGELASNTAIAAVFLPVAGAVAVGMGEPALMLALPVALFATLGFMLPVATPPNAVVFGSGAVEIRDMLRAGVVLDVVGVAVVAVGIMTIGDWVMGAG